jgi:RimJ/RimL family protein N-acetyltransferase
MQLQGTGFILRRWLEGDEESLQKHADNPNISTFLMDRFPYPYTIQDAISWVTFMQQQQPLTSFAIIINGQACGGIGVDLMDDVSRKTAEIGYWLGEPYWNRGIITEAVRILTDYAFKNLDIIRLQAGVFSKNSPSMRVLEKAGYVKEGILRNAVIKNGEVMDKHMYAILKPR